VRPDDLDRRLVGTDRAVTAERVEHGRAIPGVDPERLVDGETGTAHVVDDADREPALGCARGQLGEHRGDHRGRELLRTEPVPTTDHGDVSTIGIGESGHDVLEQRLTHRARFLRPVEHGDAPHRRRQCRQ